MAAFRIRQASRADLPELGKLGAALMRVHSAFDQKRFLEAGPDAEEGYGWFLGTQLREPQAIVLVAEADDHLLGYVYAAIEPRNWKELRDEAGFIHDLLVVESARRTGVATTLLEAAIDWLRAAGMPRVVLGTAFANTSAQGLFRRAGFRPTMIEMTREL